MHGDWRVFTLGLGSVLLAAAAGWVVYWRPTRVERRRRRSHGRIISKADRPMVRFSVRPPRDKHRN